MSLNPAKDDGSASDPKRQAKDIDQGIGLSTFRFLREILKRF
jgi:hypothetical protein